jgi:hypothetical protein
LHGFHEARGFYSIIIAAIVVGTLMSVVELDPIQALVWSEIVNAVISVPIMVGNAMIAIRQENNRLFPDRPISEHKIAPRAHSELHGSLGFSAVYLPFRIEWQGLNLV